MLKISGCVALVAAIVAVFVVAAQGRNPDLEEQEQAGRAYILQLDKQSGERKHQAALAQWAYASNITDVNQAAAVRIELELSQLEKKAWEETTRYPWRDYQDYELRRMFEKYAQLGTAALSEEKQEQLLQAVSSMESNYATAKICAYNDQTKCNMHIEPEITDVFTTSQNPEELKHTWVEWHKVAGAPVKGNFTEYVTLKNEAAKLNDYDDVAEWWLSEYEADDFEDQMANIWEQISPLYKQIHAYARRQLHDKYGDEILSRKGPIPAHLLGNVWAQQWTNIESFSRPYPDKPETDVTEAMVAQNYTALKMFHMADDFFKSLNLTAMPEKFWENSIIVKPDDGRELVCHASAWDFYDGEDFRIKMCSEIKSDDFSTVHHEMGHIQYYLQYRTKPAVFREGANPGFHEAVGDVIALSVASPKHLRKVSLLQDEAEDEQTEINQLYRMGIEKIVFLPFAYLLDLYRYGIFRGETTPDNYNCHYWDLRESLQGLEPPVARTEADFDAAAKYHVSSDVEYARYYVSFVVQFQFHRSLCQLAGEYAPGDVNKKLVDCDIYQSVDAGNALGKMLSMGSSRPWPDAMEVLTGQRKMDASGLMEYFQPLYDWLKQENERTGELIGWEESKVQYCTEDQKAALKNQKLKKKTDEAQKKN